MTATVEARGIVKAFGKKRALDGLDLTVERGQVMAILGPNGAGKTTFVSLVATLLRPDEGSLHVCGRDVERDPAAVRRLIALAGQSAAVEPVMTGRENVEMVARLFGQTHRDARHNAAEVLERIGLTGEADRPARTYSGGMRRRLDLGASLVGAPQLLLLDEPTTGLDPRSRVELWDVIHGLAAGGTDIILTTQYLDEADHLASHIAIVDRGRVIASGTPRELKRRTGRNVVEVRVRERDDIDSVAHILGGIGGDDLTIDATTHTVRITVDGEGGRIFSALQPLDTAGIALDEVSVRQPTLDEVFLSFTGATPKENVA
jgi:ABC-2 type transport system ATP-binding protein